MQNDKQIPLLPETQDILRARQHWRYTGATRPSFAHSTQPGQESVWDYPRPPRLEEVPHVLTVRIDEHVVAQTTRGKRVLETAGAPTYYFPPEDVDLNQLQFGAASSICEWKGLAQTFNVKNIANAGWRYVEMFPAFTDIYQWLSFYPNKVDCFINDELVKPQPGGYYGGWVSQNIIGPIKGGPNSHGW